MKIIENPKEPEFFWHFASYLLHCTVFCFDLANPCKLDRLAAVVLTSSTVQLFLLLVCLHTFGQIGLWTLILFGVACLSCWWLVQVSFCICFSRPRLAGMSCEAFTNTVLGFYSALTGCFVKYDKALLSCSEFLWADVLTTHTFLRLGFLDYFIACRS